MYILLTHGYTYVYRSGHDCVARELWLWPTIELNGTGGRPLLQRSRREKGPSFCVASRSGVRVWCVASAHAH